MNIDFTDQKLYVDWVNEVISAMTDTNVRYIFLKGGSGAGKSYLVAQLLTQLLIDGYRIAFFRKVSATLKGSILQLMKDIKKSWELTDSLIEIKENKEIRTKNDGLGMMFGMDNEEKIKSIANFEWAWIEEASELTYDEFEQINLRLRGGDNHKVICTFNPVSAQSFLKTQIQDKPELRKDAVWIEKTARDNRFIDADYLKSLDRLKYSNPNKYKIYALNQRGEGQKGLIFQNFHVFDRGIERPDSIGLDFGYNDPNALTYLKVVDEEGKEKKQLFIQEKIYISGQTSAELVKEMNRIGVPKDVLIIADGARPEMIKDIEKAGYKIIRVDKYKGSKQDQIDNLKVYDLHFNGANMIKEAQGWCWKLDKGGNSLDIPEDGFDHLCDSACYGGMGLKKKKKRRMFSAGG